MSRGGVRGLNVESRDEEELKIARRWLAYEVLKKIPKGLT
jgi:hypothetical protein